MNDLLANVEATALWVGTTLLGIVLGVLADFFCREPIAKFVKRRRRAWIRKHWNLRPERRTRDLKNFFLGDKATEVWLVEGDASERIELLNVSIRLDPHPYDRLPAAARLRVVDIAAEQLRLEDQCKPFAWNGDFAHVSAFGRFGRTGDTDDEKLKLNIRVQPAKYFEFMATTGAVDRAFREDAARPLEGFVDAATLESSLNAGQTPPGIVSGLPVNMFVVTAAPNRQILFAQRGNAAIASGQLACTVNENLSLKNDVVSGRPSLGMLIDRGLREEIGWDNSVYPNTGPDERPEPQVIGLAIHMPTAEYGILGYIELPLSVEEVRDAHRRAKDRQEIDELIAVDFNARAIAKFVDEHELYNVVGLCAALSFALAEGEPMTAIDAAFRRIQRNPKPPKAAAPAA